MIVALPRCAPLPGLNQALSQSCQCKSKPVLADAGFCLGASGGERVRDDDLQGFAVSQGGKPGHEGVLDVYVWDTRWWTRCLCPSMQV